MYLKVQLFALLSFIGAISLAQGVSSTGLNSLTTKPTYFGDKHVSCLYSDTKVSICCRYTDSSDAPEDFECGVHYGKFDENTDKPRVVSSDLLSVYCSPDSSGFSAISSGSMQDVSSEMALDDLKFLGGFAKTEGSNDHPDYYQFSTADVAYIKLLKISRKSAKKSGLQKGQVLHMKCSAWNSDYEPDGKRLPGIRSLVLPRSEQPANSNSPGGATQ